MFSPGECVKVQIARPHPGIQQKQVCVPGEFAGEADMASASTLKNIAFNAEPSPSRWEEQFVVCD